MNLGFPRIGLGGLFAVHIASLVGCSPADGERGVDEEPEVNPLMYTQRVQALGTAPETFRVRFETSVGDFTVEAHRAWSPRGADRFYQLVRAGFYDDTRFYRAIGNFMAQFGLHGDPQVNYAWRNEYIQDEATLQSNTRGRLAFAKGGRHSRTTELFISTKDNSYLDDQGFSPFGEVIEGMEAVDRIHTGYGEGPPQGSGPYAEMIHARGNAYLDTEFPDLTHIVRATLIDGR